MRRLRPSRRQGIGLFAIALSLILLTSTSLRSYSAPLKVAAHPLPTRLERWKPENDFSHYFSAVRSLPVGYLIWSDRPVSIYIGPSYFSDRGRQDLWESSVQAAIADWQPYFPLKITDQPNADIVIEQVRPRKSSNGRARSAQATPQAYCKGDRLAHRFTIEINPSQAGPYIKAATRHELGHALGIWGHSPNKQDVMYAAQVSEPPPISERDIHTLKKVYEQPTLLGWPAPQYCRPKASDIHPQ